MAMRDWKFWDWVGYTAIAAAAIFEAAEAGAKQAPTLLAKVPGIMNLMNAEIMGFIPLILVIFGTAVLFVRHIRTRQATASVSSFASPPSVEAELHGKPEGLTEATERRLYVGAIHASFSRLPGDGIIEITIRCFNGNEDSLQVRDLTGHVSYTGVPSTNAPVIPLPVPNLVSGIAQKAAPLSEFRVVVEQRVPQELKREIEDQRLAGKSVTFDLRDLNIMLSNRGDDMMARMPLWHGINCVPGQDAAGRNTHVSVQASTHPTSVVT